MSAMEIIKGAQDYMKRYRYDMPEERISGLLYSVETDKQNKTITIRPTEHGKITLYGPEWADQFLSIISHQSQLLWNK